MTDTDAIYLLDIDLKGSEIPLGIEEWQIIANLSNWVIFVADWMGEPTGFIVFDSTPQAVEVHKLSCKPIERSSTILETLLGVAEAEARVTGSNLVRCLVPECSCGGAYDVADWLNSMGYLATKVEPDMFWFYGRNYDTFHFEKHTRESTTYVL
jgi:hypothetical protein